MRFMVLDDIPVVDIEHKGVYRFVQVIGPDNRTYLYGNSKWTSHNDVFRSGF